MRSLLLAAFALATFLPQQSPAETLLAGSFDGNTENGPVFGSDSIHFNVIKLFIPGPDAFYIHEVTFAVDFIGVLRVYTAFPDLTDLSINHFFSSAPVTEIWGLSSNTPLYFLVSGVSTGDFGNYSFEFAGEQPVFLTDVTPYDTSAVPEPSTAALVALGIGSILYRFRRR